MATLVTPRPQPRACGRTHAAHQAQVWLVTFGSYMAFHWSRKIYSVVKSQMGPGLALSTTEIGALDTIFLASYALCMPVSGYFVDRREHRTLLGWAMIGAGAGCACTLGLGLRLDSVARALQLRLQLAAARDASTNQTHVGKMQIEC